MDQTLTIVLPVYNGERFLRKSVMDVLEVVSDLSLETRVLIVDDGSHDDTFETASELSRMLPQVEVLRNSARGGLNAVLERVTRRYPGVSAIVHNGIGKIDTNELRAMLARAPEPSTARRSELQQPERGSRRFAEVRRLHEKMEEVHRKPGMFTWVRVDAKPKPRQSSPVQQTRQTPVISAAWSGASDSSGIPTLG